ncbi:uncharacterized protein LOC101538941 [Sorex araneus]|uniref:uncharacterized protein LOC101538941 n=1 Tax=Sorex araneus TaxID=42254 RepID=UPI002433B0C7|nr:uncharacterized protein LOC101538941 [Sorex araneus]
MPKSCHDWHLTSSGVAHHLIPPIGFYPANVQSTIGDPLPLGVRHDLHVWDFDEVISRWETTSGKAYEHKNLSGPLAQPRASELSDPRRTMGMKELSGKFRHSGCSFPQIVRQRCSETKAQYTGWPNVDPRVPASAGLQFLALVSGHGGRLSQSPELAGRIFRVKDRGILDRHQPYLSTMTKDFQPFSEKELSESPFGESPAARAWALEQRLSQHSWQDRPLGIRASRVGPVGPVVPHRGALSETRESYGPPVPPLDRLNLLCPLTLPWGGLHWNPVPGIHSVPHAYSTENSQYGSSRPALI